MASDSGGDSSDARFLDVLSRRYGKRLRSFLRRCTGSRHIAEDLVQEALARLAGRRNVAKLEVARDYLYRIALNLLQKHREEQRADPTVPLHPAILRTLTTNGDPEFTGAELEQQLERALQRMTPRQRAMLPLSARGLSYGDIADALGVSKAVVGQDLMHARQIIQEELQSSGQGKVQP